MAHEKLNISITREWVSANAKLEPDVGVTSVGGLAHRVSGLDRPNDPAKAEECATFTAVASADPRRQSLGKLIELSRRRMRLSMEELSNRANVDLAELFAIEKAEDIVPEPRTVYQLAQVLQVRVEPLLELAGLVEPKSIRLTESAVRFAARSEPMDMLTKEEEAALKLVRKGVDQDIVAGFRGGCAIEEYRAKNSRT